MVNQHTATINQLRENNEDFQRELFLKKEENLELNKQI